MAIPKWKVCEWVPKITIVLIFLDETVDLFINDENPDDWDSSMINDEESLFLSFDEERLNFDEIDKL